MQFIINHFLSVLKSFGVKVKETWNTDGTCSLDFYDLSPSLDIILLKLKYDEIIGYDTVVHKDGITETRITRTVKIFVPFGTHKGRYLRCVLDQDTYAKKINCIEPVLRKYHKDHPIAGLSIRFTH